MLNIRPAYRTSIGTCARAWWCRISMHLATAYVQDSLRQSKISNNWTSKIVYKDIGLKRQRGYTTLNWENLRPKTRKRDILLWDHRERQQVCNDVGMKYQKQSHRATRRKKKGEKKSTDPSTYAKKSQDSEETPNRKNYAQVEGGLRWGSSLVNTLRSSHSRTNRKPSL